MTDIYSEAWEEYGELAGELLIKYKPKFCKIVRKWCHYCQHEFDDMYGEVVTWQLPRYIHTYDMTKSDQDIMTYIFNTIGWNCYKWLKRKKPKPSPEVPDVGTQQPSLVEAEMLLANLDPDDAWIIEQRVLYGYTFEELADALDITKAAARRQYNKAIYNAQGVILDE